MGAQEGVLGQAEHVDRLAVGVESPAVGTEEEDGIVALFKQGPVGPFPGLEGLLGLLAFADVLDDPVDRRKPSIGVAKGDGRDRGREDVAVPPAQADFAMAHEAQGFQGAQESPPVVGRFIDFHDPQAPQIFE